MREVVRQAGRIAAYILATPFVLLAILVIPILNLLGLNKSSAGPDYVADYLDRFIAGSEGQWDWDDFCSVPLKDEHLNSIVERACAFAPPGDLGDAERDELRKLLAEVRMTANAEPVA